MRECTSRRHALATCAIAVAAIVLGTGCDGSDDDAGGSGESGEQVTLRMIDNDNASEGAVNTVLEKLIADYEREHPNVDIKRTTKAYNDYIAATRLEATGPNPPDIIQGDIGLSLDGPLVKAGALLPLDRFDDKYGWTERFGEGAMQPFRFGDGGAVWGEGELYGVSSKAELVWVYYNKSKLKELGLEVPKTLAEFEEALARAKQAGEVPIMFGNTDQWPATHVYAVIQNALAPADEIRSWALGQDGANFDTPEDVEAAAKLVDWVDKGYIADGFSGISYDSSLGRFGKGDGVFMITGTWANQTFVEALKDDVGAFLLPSASGELPAVTGGLADPWHVSAKSEHPEVAADFVDSLVNEHGAEVYAKHDAIPSGSVPANRFPAGSLAPQVTEALEKAMKANAMVPYLSFPTPTIGPKTLFPALQELMAGQTSPEDFAKRVQADWETGRK